MKKTTKTKSFLNAVSNENSSLSFSGHKENTWEKGKEGDRVQEKTRIPFAASLRGNRGISGKRGKKEFVRKRKVQKRKGKRERKKDEVKLSLLSLHEKERVKKETKYEEFLNKKHPFEITRSAYYQSGKCVALFPRHPNLLPLFFLKLWPKKNKNNREHQKQSAFKNSFFLNMNEFICEKYESYFIALYGGKSGETFVYSFNSHTNNPLYKTNKKMIKKKGDEGIVTTKRREKEQKKEKERVFSNSLCLWESSLGVEDLFVAHQTACLLVKKLFLKPFVSPAFSFSFNYNNSQNAEIKLKIMLQKPSRNIDNKEKENKNKKLYRSFSKYKKENEKAQRAQETQAVKLDWWKKKVNQQTGGFHSKPATFSWNLFYLFDPKRSVRNLEFLHIEWVYLNRKNLTDLLQAKQKKKEIQYKNQIFFDFALYFFQFCFNKNVIYHALVFTFFNKAVLLLDKNRELLDYLADYLIRFEIVQQHKTLQIFSLFGYPNKSSLL